MLGQITERQLRDDCRALVMRTRESLGENVSQTSLLNQLELTLKKGRLPKGKDGAYSAQTREIVINQEINSPERWNFTFYHEVTHHLLRNDDSFYSALHDFACKEQSFERTLESLCNIGAAEFLLPGHQVRSLIEREGFSIQHLKVFCDHRQASMPAAAIQLAQHAAHNCYIVICEIGLPTSSSCQPKLISSLTQSPILYVLYSAGSPSAKYTISRYTMIPAGHLIQEAHRAQTTMVGSDLIPFKSGKKWPVPCEAMFFRGKTIAVFNVTEPVTPLQSRLF